MIYSVHMKCLDVCCYDFVSALHPRSQFLKKNTNSIGPNVEGSTKHTNMLNSTKKRLRPIYIAVSLDSRTGDRGYSKIDSDPPF